MTEETKSITARKRAFSEGVFQITLPGEDEDRVYKLSFPSKAPIAELFAVVQHIAESISSQLQELESSAKEKEEKAEAEKELHRLKEEHAKREEELRKLEDKVFNRSSTDIPEAKKEADGTYSMSLADFERAPRVQNIGD